MSTETSTVGLDLQGTFAAMAEADAAAADKLAAKLDKLNTAGAKSPKTQRGDVAAAKGEYAAQAKELEHIAQLEEKIAKFDAGKVRKIATLEANYKAMHKAAVGDIGKEPKESVAGENQSLLSGAGALAAGGLIALEAGKMILNAAKELALAAVDLLRGAEELAIAQTSKREGQTAIMGKLGGSYDATVKLAAKYGIDEDKAVEEAKKLLGAKFKAEEIPLLVKLNLGIGAVLGEEKAKAFLEQLAKNKLKGGKASEETVKGFAEAGIDVEAVWKRLATKMGTSVAIAQAKVKAGAVDMATVLEAVKAQAGSQFGDIAEKMGNSVPALLMRVKSDFAHMFDDIDLTPFKDVLKNVAAVMEGPEGGQLKGSIKELLDAINHAFLDQFRGEDGKKKLQEFAKGAADGLHELAGAVKELKPVIELMTKIGALGSLGFLDKFTNDIKLFAIVCNLLLDAGDKVSGFIDEVLNLLGLGQDTAGSGNEIGTSLVDGFVEGIEGGVSRAVAAAVAMGVDTISALRGILGVASPSKEFAWLGDMSAEGFAGGMAANDSVEGAAAGMGNRALGAAGGAGGGAGGAGGIVFAPNIILPPGSGAEHAAAVNAALSAAYPEFLALIRRAQREGVLPRAA